MPHCPTFERRRRWGSHSRRGWLVCVRVRDGGRGARRQSLGTEPGMPLLRAKQEHGEPRGCKLASNHSLLAPATAMAECAVPFALVRNRTASSASPKWATTFSRFSNTTKKELIEHRGAHWCRAVVLRFRLCEGFRNCWVSTDKDLVLCKEDWTL